MCRNWFESGASSFRASAKSETSDERLHADAECLEHGLADQLRVRRISGAQVEGRDAGHDRSMDATVWKGPELGVGAGSDRDQAIDRHRRVGVVRVVAEVAGGGVAIEVYEAVEQRADGADAWVVGSVDALRGGTSGRGIGGRSQQRMHRQRRDPSGAEFPPVIARVLRLT